MHLNKSVVAHRLIPTLGKLRREDHNFEVSLGYIVRPCKQTKPRFFLPLSAFELLPNGPRRSLLAHYPGSSTAYSIPGLSFPIFHHLKVLDLERMPLEGLTSNPKCHRLGGI